MTHKHSSPIVVQAFAAPFARYPGYVTSATRSRDQHVIVIVLTRPASTVSPLVRKLAHAQHHAAPPKRRQNNVKNVTGRKIGVDRPWGNHAVGSQYRFMIGPMVRCCKVINLVIIKYVTISEYVNTRHR